MTATDQPRLDHDLRCASWESDSAAACDCRDDSGHSPIVCWADGRMLGWDLETTGQDPRQARIVTATVVDIRPGKKPIITNWLSDVDGEEIPEGAAEIHGVTTEDARKNGRPLADVVNELIGALDFAAESSVPNVGHNIGTYDHLVLACEARRFDLKPHDTGLIVDTIVLDRAMNRRYGKGAHTLTSACAAYSLTLSEEDAHSSAADALFAARLAWKIAHRFPLVGHMPLRALQEWQAAEHRKFADNLGRYFKRVGKPDDVVREWPARAGA